MSESYDIVAMGDNHGDKACTETLNAILTFCSRVKPRYKVHLGDNWDYRWARKGVDRQSKEGRERLDEDFSAGAKWIKEFRPTHFLHGNHDDRIRQIITNTDSIRDQEDMQKVEQAMRTTLRQNGCKVIKPYTVKEGVVRIGPITFIHGFSHGQNALLKDARTFGTPGGGFCMGHLHRLEQLNIENYDGGAAWLCGWAGIQEEAEYSFRMSSSLRWQNGFMYFKVVGNDYIGKQAHRFGKGWYFPNGEIYRP